MLLSKINITFLSIIPQIERFIQIFTSMHLSLRIQSKMSHSKINFYKNSYSPSKAFENCQIKINLPAGENKECKQSNLFIDFDFFEKNKIYDSTYTDVIIELWCMDKAGSNLEFLLATFCKIISPNKNNNDYTIKAQYQKCKVFSSEWYQLEDIYGLTTDEKLCEICCCNNKNTYFLPCKHSYACKDCAIMLRIKGNGCPICRQRKFKYLYIKYSDIRISCA